METELLRTFFEVNRMRSFTRAAENLFLTPSAVSARIRQLEGEVGRPVFRRTSQQVELTPAGERLLRHAMGILDAWERAQRDLALEERREQVTVAGVASFWDMFLQQWLNGVHARLPDVVLWVEVSTAVRIAEKLAQAEIHLGFLYSPPRLSDLVLRELGVAELILVSSRPELGVREALAEDYVLVDWGTVFASQHARSFPDRPAAAARSNSGRVALEMIRAGGGSAYLPRTLVEAELTAGRLHRVDQAPAFEMQIYAAYAAHSDQRELVEALLKYF